MKAAAKKPPPSPLRRAKDTAVGAAVRFALTPAHLAGPRVAPEFADSIGPVFGSAPFNRKRVDRAVERLSVALPGLDEDRRRALVMRSYAHLFRLGAEFALLPRLINEDGWQEHVELGNLLTLMDTMLARGPVILITGHCGNWEVVAYALSLLGFPMHVVYRPLEVEPLDRWVRQTRARRGLELVDKFGAVRRLPELLGRGERVGFVADQNAGDRGLFVPFLGRLASSYKSIGLLAMQFGAPVVVGWAERLPTRPTQPGMRFRIVIEDAFGPDAWNDHPDPMFYITARYRRAIEQMVRKRPEQYLWMHRIWKSRPRHERLDRPFPPQLRDKLGTLPWLDDAGVGALVERSEQDRAWLREQGTDRLP